MKNSVLYIRTDANEVIATGHVMRCLTIAEEYRKKAGEVCFIISDENLAKMIDRRRYNVIVTNTKWNSVDIESEYKLLKHKIRRSDWLLIDSYHIYSSYAARIKQLLNVVVFDDMFSEKKIADVIINYNVFYRRFDYLNRYKHEKCILLLGEKYVPLRKQFREIEPEINVRKYERPKILLMCGGADKPNLIYETLQYLKENKPELFLQVDWKIVVGSFYSNIDQLNLLIQGYLNIELLCNVENMAALMNKCDLCVTAASTVLYECCAMLLPTLFFVVSEDQKYDAEVFSKDNMLLYCGNYMDGKKEALKRMEVVLSKIVKNREQQYKMKQMMKKFVDAKGAERIVAALMGEKNE